MDKNRNTASNVAGRNTEGNKVKSRYIAKDKEIITVTLGSKLVEIRRVWDSKKKSLKEELIKINNDEPDTFKRNLLVVDACISAVGLKWADAPIKEVGNVAWKEGDDEYESPRVRIKFLMNGGQVRVVRNEDGTQKVELDCVTERTVTQCIKDAQSWSSEDQQALDAYKAGLQRRKADRQRHEAYEKAYVHTFSCESLFASAGL